MSHIVQIQSEIRDGAAVRAACNRLGLAEPVEGTARLFSGEVSGLAVQLPHWKYPIICDVSTGQVRYDNYSGRWGAEEELNCFKQAYSVEKAKIEARKRGHNITEQPLSDGSIKLIVGIQGGGV